MADEDPGVIPNVRNSYVKKDRLLQDEFSSPVTKPRSTILKSTSAASTKSNLSRSGFEHEHVPKPPSFVCDIIVHNDKAEALEECNNLEETTSCSESSADGEDKPDQVKDGIFLDPAPSASSRGMFQNRFCAVVFVVIVWLVAFIAVSRSESSQIGSSSTGSGLDSTDSASEIVWMPLNDAIESDLTNEFGFLAMSGDGSSFAFTNFNHQQNVGRVRVVRDMDGEWKEMGQVLHGPINNNWYGSSLDLSDDGKILCIGIPSPSLDDTSVGLAMVYEYDEAQDVWNHLVEIEGRNAWFGRAVSLSADGSILAVSSSNPDPTERETDYSSVYRIDGTLSHQIGVFDEGSHSTKLSFDGTTVGLTDVEFTKDGFSSHVQVYKHSNETWFAIGGKIYIGAEQDALGKTTDMSADGTIIAAGLEPIRVYYYYNSQWSQFGNDIEGTDAVSIALSADGMTLAIRTPTLIRVYEYQDELGWTQAIDLAVGDFGASVAFSDDGTTVAASGSDSIRVFRSRYI